MTPQEREVIGGIFDRLKQVEGHSRDPEAEALIAERVRAQPYAPYAMAQAVYVQEQALINLQRELEQARAENEQLRSQPQGGGGFLSSLFGGGAPQGPAPRMGQPDQDLGQRSVGPQGLGRPPGLGAQADNAPPDSPWARRQGGGGFLQGALATAAGVAGGMMLGNVLMNAFGGGEAKADTPATPSTPAETASAAPDQGDNQHDADADGYDDASFDDGGLDVGGDDWG